jgi:hypothetical protein
MTAFKMLPVLWSQIRDLASPPFQDIIMIKKKRNAKVLCGAVAEELSLLKPWKTVI